MERETKEYGRLNSSASSDVFEPASVNDAKTRTSVIEWLNCTLSNLNLPINSSDEELRTLLVDGTILCRLMNQLNPGFDIKYVNPHHSSEAQSENVHKFLATMDEMGLPHFNISELEKGSMKIVLESLLTLKAHFMQNVAVCSPNAFSPKTLGSDSFRWKHTDEHNGTSDSFQEDISPRKIQRALRSPAISVSKCYYLQWQYLLSCLKQAIRWSLGFNKIFLEWIQSLVSQQRNEKKPKTYRKEQMRQYRVSTILAKFQIAPTQSLLSMVNGILDESMGRKNGEIPHQNNLFKTREEKYQSRIRVLEALANGTSGETKAAVINHFEHMKMMTSPFDQIKLGQLLATIVPWVVSIQQPNQNKKKITSYRLQMLATTTTTRTRMVTADKVSEPATDTAPTYTFSHEDNSRLQQLLTSSRLLLVHKPTQPTQVYSLAYLPVLIHKYDFSVRGIGSISNSPNLNLSSVLQVTKFLDSLDTDFESSGLYSLSLPSQPKIKYNFSIREAHCRLGHPSAAISWQRCLIEFDASMVNTKRSSLLILTKMMSREEKKPEDEDVEIIGKDSKSAEIEALKQELENARKTHKEESARKAQPDLEKKLKDVENHLSESKMKLQELEAKLRSKSHVWNNKEHIYKTFTEFQLGALKVNPAKPGKESRRSFKYNKVYGPHATQAEVYGDIQQLVQSVLDGYNVCIFAYGQTGSGKTYTMSGPDKGSQEEWGVNYRALNDLFRISQSRSTYKYEVGVQMVEIYNEQVRDLLANDVAQKRYPFIANYLAVPDANMHEVSEPSDVMRIMEIGFKNRARSTTAMNERSSRSHSVVTIHVHGTDLKNGGSLNAGLHLVDLAGSERIDRAEVVGDRLKEAQHINKSLAALGDVIFSLSQKSPHVPFRNSKLTQLLQASLGGQAKTLMLVQLNPEAASYAESLSTLKFAERVSGVELGPARSCKEASNVKDLMEQVASLKLTITKRDEEIERLQVIKDKKNAHPPSIGQHSMRYGSSSPNSKLGNKPRTESIRGRMSLDGYGYKPVRKGQSLHGEDTDSSLESSPSREGSKSFHNSN
ncbi:hypothetical protein R6Q59_020317, partial [Mikania micrantha]